MTSFDFTFSEFAPNISLAHKGFDLWSLKYRDNCSKNICGQHSKYSSCLQTIYPIGEMLIAVSRFFQEPAQGCDCSDIVSAEPHQSSRKQSAR